MLSSHRFALRSERAIISGGEQPATIVIDGERIEAVLDYDAAVDCAVQDLGSKALLPGLVDTHVHINEPGRTEWEGFNTATRAAAAGGITTVVDMPLNCTPVTTSAAALRQKIDSLDHKLWIDCGFWGGVVPQSLNDLDELLQAGVLGVKSFTIHSGIDDFRQVERSHIRRAIPVLAKYDLPYLIHAELDTGHNEPPGIGRRYQSFLASRPRQWENSAIAMLIELGHEARQAGINPRIHIVHLSSADAIAAIRAAQQAGLRLSVETCPHYLTLCAESIADGETLFKCCPPIREDENRQRLWQGLAGGEIDFIVSDHSPCTPELKLIDSGDIEHAWGGISSLQFGLSIIWTEARARGCSLAQVTDWMATQPAVFAGLAQRKGGIAPGRDADFVVFDTAASYSITPEMIKYRHKITPYAGRQVSGVVARTYLRGRQIYADGELVGEPMGQTLLREH